MLSAARRIIAGLGPLTVGVLWALSATATEPAVAPPGTGDNASDGRAVTALEAAFSKRAGEPLRQFGYDLFAAAPAGAEASRVPIGAVPDDYILGPGDVLTVTMRGEVNARRDYTIDREGRLLVDDLLGPLPAAGRRLGELRAELRSAVAAAHTVVETFVSLAEVRRITVVVTGAVRRPGRHELTSFGTVLDALAAAGGITPTGSLRAITLLGGGTARTVDLYDLLTTGGGLATHPVRDGDRLFVPVIGPTVAVGGPVKRPGVFELPAGRGRATVDELQTMAGRLIRPAAVRALRLGLRNDGSETAEEVADPTAAVFGDGDLLMLAPRREDRRGVVRLEGHVFRPGPRSLDSARTLIDLVAESDLRPDPYRAFAVLMTRDPATGATTLRPVDLAAILEGRTDHRLSENDTLVVLGAEDVAFLTAEPVLSLLRTPRAAEPGACRGLVALARALTAEPHGSLARGPQARAAAGIAGPDLPCPAVFDDYPDLLGFALDRSVFVRTGVARPGFYPVARSTAAATLERLAGVFDAGSLGTGRADIGAVVDAQTPRIEMRGHVRHPGVRPLAQAPTLRAALDQGRALEPGVYPLIAVVERFDRPSLTSVLIPFSPRAVAAGRLDRTLVDGDRIHVFSVDQVRALMASATGDPRAPARPVAMAKAPAAVPDPPTDEPSAAVDVPDLSDTVAPAIAAALVERAVQVRGAVRMPGTYPVADTGELHAVIDAAGGLSTNADPAAVEVTAAGQPARRRLADLTRPQDRRLPVTAGDSIRVGSTLPVLEARAVTILGEVRRPGSYDVLRGERLSELIERAGGLTGDAYPGGTVFLRDSERRRLKAENDQQALGIDRTVLLMEQSGDPMPEKQAARARLLAAQLRGLEPVGRITVEADPAVLRARPELDPLLEADDRIVIPKRPHTVMVAGEVNSPGAFPFVSGRDAGDYLRDAGGTTADADEDRVYVVLPNGRSEPVAISSWNHAVRTVPPGSLIVVPRDPRPYGFLTVAGNIGGILGQIAVTAASIAVISR